MTFIDSKTVQTINIADSCPGRFTLHKYTGGDKNSEHRKNYSRMNCIKYFFSGNTKDLIYIRVLTLTRTLFLKDYS